VRPTASSHPAQTPFDQQIRIRGDAPPRALASHCHTWCVKVRVYELARELGVDSATVLSRLRQLGEFARSAASVVPDPVARRLRATMLDPDEPLPAIGIARSSQSQGWSTDDWQDERLWWEEDRWWSYAPAVILTHEAARACRVSASTIRQWVTRGYLAPTGRQGRELTFAASDVRDSQIARQSRTKSGSAVIPRWLRARDMDALITTKEAASLLGVSASTIRMWVKRGIIAPQSRAQRRNLYQVKDVITAARRR